MDAETKRNVKELFDRFDSNHNGVLDKEEFLKGFPELIKSLSDGQTDAEIKEIAEEAIDKFDLNKNGEIEFDEFSELMFFLINEKGLSIYDVL